jgi:hypothetical protein
VDENEKFCGRDLTSLISFTFQAWEWVVMFTLQPNFQQCFSPESSYSSTCSWQFRGNRNHYWAAIGFPFSVPCRRISGTKRWCAVSTMYAGMVCTWCSTLKWIVKYVMCNSKNSLNHPWLMKGRIQGTYRLSLALRWQICNGYGSASEKYRKMIIQWMLEDMIFSILCSLKWKVVCSLKKFFMLLSGYMQDFPLLSM